MSSNSWKYALLLSACWACPACDSTDLGLDGPGPDRSIAGSPGQFITPASDFGRVFWPEHRHIVITNPGSTSISAVDTEVRGSEQLAWGEGQLLTHATTRDLKTALVVESAAGGYRLFRHTAGERIEIAHRPVSGFGAPQDGSPVLAGRVSDRIAFVADPDSLYLLEGSVVRFVARGCRTLFDFSPDDSSLLCGADPGRFGGLVTVDLGSGLAIPRGHPALQYVWGGFRWGEDGIEHISFEGIVSLDAGSARSTNWTATTGESSTPYVAWSADGRSIAHVTRFCAQTEGILGCARTQFLFHVWKAEWSEWRRVAVQELTPTSSGFVKLAFSPDAAHLAYAMNGGLYVVTLSE